MCRSVTPVILISHLPILCQLKQIPLITLHAQINTRMMAHALIDANEARQPQDIHKAAHRRRILLCTCVGIKRDSFPDALTSLLPFSHVPALSWLTQPVGFPPVGASYKQVNVKNTDGDKKPKQLSKQKQQQLQLKEATKQGTTAPTEAAASTPSASSTSHSKPRFESATQRKKKQKLMQQQP